MVITDADILSRNQIPFSYPIALAKNCSWRTHGIPMLCIVELETKHVLGFDTASQGQQGAMTQNRPSNNSSGAPLQSPTNAWDKPLKSPVVAAPSTPSGAHGMGGSVSSVGDKTVGSNSVIGAGGPTG